MELQCWLVLELGSGRQNQFQYYYHFPQLQRSISCTLLSVMRAWPRIVFTSFESRSVRWVAMGVVKWVGRQVPHGTLPG